jgi:hypothetical protein
MSIKRWLRDPRRDAVEMQQRIYEADYKNLAKQGIAYDSPEAVPYHLAQLKADTVLIVSYLSAIAQYAQSIFILLLIIAFMLFFGLNR